MSQRTHVLQFPGEFAFFALPQLKHYIYISGPYTTVRYYPAQLLGDARAIGRDCTVKFSTVTVYKTVVGIRTTRQLES